MLTIQSLRKIHPPATVALDGVSLSVGHGVFGLLGPNGAGKSSLMEILAANLDFEEGRVLLDEAVDVQRHPTEWRRRLGYLPQTFDFPTHTTGREMLREGLLLLGLSPRVMKARVDELLERANLTWAADRDCARYSRGMKQRLGFVYAILHNPRLLLLDEPTAGLDPVERVFFRELLTEIARDRIVILSTHIVADVERCCSMIGVLDKGRLLYIGPPQDLVAQAHGRVWEMPVTEAEIDQLAQDRRIVSITRRHDRPFARVVSEAQPTPEAEPVEARLEDAYVHLLGGMRPGS